MSDNNIQTSNNKPLNHDFKSDLKRRVAENKATRWVRFAIVAIIYVLWVIWLGNYWWLLGLILLFDIYITGYIPFTWWKRSKSSAVRGIMSWVDAIVYALILVYFIFNFVGQNYEIPSASLEKTLLTGDYLWVNKLTYGPRVPMTPVHFPLVHNTMPIVNSDSYLDNPSVAYKRLKGLRNVESGDIVVFNFPAGDSVMTHAPQGADYYTLQKFFGGRQAVVGNPAFGTLKYYPVDRRENYVKRAVGLPGQRLRISNDTLYIDGVAQPFPENVQFRYLAGFAMPLSPEQAHDLGISIDDIASGQLTGEDITNLRTLGVSLPDGLVYYSMPLSQKIIAEATAAGLLKSTVKWNDIETAHPGVFRQPYLFPEVASQEWTLANYGGDQGILIPKKGLTVTLTPENWDLYHRAIRNYEGHTDAYLNPADGRVYIDGKVADTYTFAMDYYFMMGDNRDNSQDSRFWGFVPEDHIVGTPMLVLISFDKDRGLFNGGIRWNRVLTTANPDK